MSERGPFRGNSRCRFGALPIPSVELLKQRPPPACNIHVKVSIHRSAWLIVAYFFAHGHGAYWATCATLLVTPRT